jgi:putative ABC transport system permease protein
MMTARRWEPAFSWLDVKLGLRMMRKYPGVSLAIVFALAIGIPVSLLPNHLVESALRQSPPFDEGERVVGVVGVGQDGRAELRVGDYEILRERVKTFASLGAVLLTEVNVVSGDGWSDGESAALMTATVFTLARVQPIMGRALLAADEVPGAADVALVSYSFWRRRLGGADNVVGTTLRIAGVPTTIVGVMPEGFAMPSVQQLWLPLRVRSADDPNGLGPGVRIYGRLADGVSVAQARAELRAVRLPTSQERRQGVPVEAFGARPSPIQADAVAFSAVEIPEPEGALAWILAIAQVVPVIVLLIACGNAAILILARTATRWNEVAMRTVLGASRARIMGQLFVETLLLSLIATGIGLIAIDIAVARLAPRFSLPFWFDPNIGPAFALKALGLSVLCAVVAGVLPALRATGGKLQSSIQSAGAGGSTLRLGRVAGALIVIEVGFAIVALFPAVMAWRLFQPNPDGNTRVAAADRYLVASIRVPATADQYLVGSFRIPASSRLTVGENEALRVRIGSLQEELGRRLMLQPGVRRWTFSDQPPGEERDERFRGVATFVDPGFFAVLDVSPVAGRLFDAGDVSRDAVVEPAAVIVNMKWLERQGRDAQSAIGSRFKLDEDRGSTPAQWKEIVGVVPNIEPSADRVFADGTPVVFMAAAQGTLNPMTVTIDLGERPLAFASKLRSLVADVDPTAFVTEVAALDHLPMPVNVLAMASSIMTGLSLLAMALSATGLYALMSMTVAQRRREFGIRLALGGSARGVMVTVARRALVQIGIGVTWGAVMWVALMSSVLKAAPGTEAAKMRGPWPYVLGASVVIVIAVALIAALWPTLRYVRMRPVETLRVDG